MGCLLVSQGIGDLGLLPGGVHGPLPRALFLPHPGGTFLRIRSPPCYTVQPQNCEYSKPGVWVEGFVKELCGIFLFFFNILEMWLILVHLEI